MAQTKPAGSWTYEDLFSLPDDGRRYEIVEGELYEMPSQGMDHATTLMNLITLLLPIATAMEARWLTAPLDVFLPGADPVQPDLLMIFPDGAARTVPRGIEGAPDLVVEVVIPPSRDRDELLKRSLYARAGVREYWLVDPETRVIEILTLDRDAFHLAVAATGDETPVSPLLGPLPITAAGLFAGIDA